MLTRQALAALFDHTNLNPQATDQDFALLCQEAAENHFAMVAIHSAPVALCKKHLLGSGVHVGAAISFPFGQTTLPVKLAETKDAIANGADEIDYVLNIAQLKMGNHSYLREEMNAITTLCHTTGVLCKVILENCYLTNAEICTVAEIAKDVRPDFIKTSTGFGPHGAKAEDVRLMKACVGDTVGIKAAGGIRDLSTCLAMIEAGATRIGTSSSLKILAELSACS